MKVSATSSAAQEMLGREAEQLVRDLKAVEKSYGTGVLTLTVCRGYFRRLLANPRMDKSLAKSHPDLLDALKESISEQ